MVYEDCWLQITSGRDPIECCWAVAQVADKFLAEARSYGLNSKIITTTPGPEAKTFKSILLGLSGDVRQFILVTNSQTNKGRNYRRQ